MSSPVTIAASASQYKIIKTLFASNATPQKMIGANGNRVALIFNDATGSINLGTVDKQPSTSAGLLSLESAAPFAMLTFAQFGPLVQDEWWSCRLSGTSTTGIIEVIFNPTGG